MDISANIKFEEMGLSVDTFSESAIEAFKKAFFGTGVTVRDHWIDLAQKNLTTSRSTYIEGLQKADTIRNYMTGNVLVVEIQLIGRMPNAFEYGMPSFDMKSVRPGWLGGGKAKAGKDGKMYVTIPFRHSTSSSARLAYSGKAARDNLQQELRKTVKQYGLNRLIKSSSGAIAEGPVARVPKDASVHRYLHGLTKIQKASPSGGRHSSSMMTWRRISENSEPGSWIHPGIEKKNLLPRVGRFADQELERIINMIFRGAA